MLGRLRQLYQRRLWQRHIRENVRVPLERVEARIAQLTGCRACAICPTPTGRHWQGVLSATEGLFGSAVFQLPQHYSAPAYDTQELGRIADMLVAANVQTVVFSGYLPYFDVMIRRLAARGVTVSVIYHGSHVTVFEDPATAQHFETFLAFAKQGLISRVGLVKKGLDHTLRQLVGLNTFPIHLTTPDDVFAAKATALKGTNIGALTHGDFRKNIYNQVAAALMVPDATVHMKEPYHASYLGNAERIAFHPHASQRKDFLSLVGSMTANLYVTYSECWGQLVTESLALGVPCLASDVSAVLDFDPEMKRRLVVTELDNDFAIYEKLCEVLEEPGWFKDRGPAYVRRVNQMAKATLDEFLA